MEWCGIVTSGFFGNREETLRKGLAHAAENREWDDLFAVLEERPDLVNAVFLDDPLWQAPIHTLALQHASVEVANGLVRRGAWRTLRTREGLTAAEIATQLGEDHLAGELKPAFLHTVDLAQLSRIQAHFHRVIAGRIEVIPEWELLRLPELEVLLEMDEPALWFPVPGMYGGFSYRLVFEDDALKLVSGSWCRVVGGSEQTHEITPEGSVLTQEGE